VYSREIEGQVTTFGVSGKLIRNVMVMYDRQTGSLWSQLLGEAIDGEFEGTELEFLPSWMMTWQEWKARHPDTLALVKGYSGGSDPYDAYYETDQAGVLGEERYDDRLWVKQYVVGVALGDEAVAYPWSGLSLEPVVNDVLNGTPLLVVFGEDARTGVVFERELNGQILSFSPGDPDVLMLTDAETGSTWDGLAGRAVAGPLAGEHLERVKSTASFWFGWKDWYPETRVYGLDE
jgi:hypothetical protein